MAAPNIVNVTSIYGRTQYGTLGTTILAYANNASNSGKVYKINTITVANIDGTNAADVTVQITTANSTGALWYLAKTISVPADSTLVVTSKDTSFYLEENRAIRAFASASSDLSIMVSYDELDDA